MILDIIIALFMNPCSFSIFIIIILINILNGGDK